MSGEHVVKLSDAEFASWSERGRNAARFRVDIRRAARQTACDMGLDGANVVGPDGALLERVAVDTGAAFSGIGCAAHADAPYSYCENCR